jgi:ABC-2 type transport system ATP-binding protein
MIELKKINKSFGKRMVLKNINLTFDEGNVIGFVGENGSGKTTLFNCITGLEKCEGDITYSGKELKNDLGFLQTEPYILNKITGNEYLQLFCNSRNLDKTNIKSQNIFDLPLNEYVETYSTGMRKKLTLTGILLQKNKVYILDEPFNGVDMNGNLIIKQIIFKLKDLNRLVLISSHIFSSLTEICDLIYLVKNGEIIKGYTKSDFKELEGVMTNSSVINSVNNLNLI